MRKHNAKQKPGSLLSSAGSCREIPSTLNRSRGPVTPFEGVRPDDRLGRVNLCYRTLSQAGA
jgi:hypothetical protein